MNSLEWLRKNPNQKPIIIAIIENHKNEFTLYAYDKAHDGVQRVSTNKEFAEKWKQKVSSVSFDLAFDPASSEAHGTIHIYKGLLDEAYDISVVTNKTSADDIFTHAIVVRTRDGTAFPIYNTISSSPFEQLCQSLFNRITLYRKMNQNAVYVNMTPQIKPI